MITRYLAEAQAEIEQEVGYPLCLTWIEDEQRPYSWPLMSAMGYVVSGGVRAETDVQADAAISYATEPTTIGPIATTLTDTSEIHVFYPDSEREITPQAMTISGGFLTIWIPRCRLVTPEQFNTSRDHPVDYNDVSNFLAVVDVKRVYNDPSTHAVLIWPHACSGNLCACSCDDYRATGCIYVKNGKMGILDVSPATYSSGAWNSARTTACRGTPDSVLLNYYAGRYPVTYQAEDAIIRLAHSKMPDEPCGCDDTQRLWERDRNVPETLTRERVNCPFGLSDGAWVAWRFTQTMKLHRLGLSL